MDAAAPPGLAADNAQRGANPPCRRVRVPAGSQGNREVREADAREAGPSAPAIGLSITMRVFISWSGERSHRVATSVHTWICRAFPTLDPWLSSEMEKGKSWAAKLLDGLATSTIGILCVTAEAN